MREDDRVRVRPEFIEKIGRVHERDMELKESPGAAGAFRS